MLQQFVGILPLIGIFDDFKNYVASAIGVDPITAGAILGSVLAVVLLVALTWIIDPKGQMGTTPFLISGTVGMIVATVIGWLPLWAPLVIVVIVIFVWQNPFGGGTSG